MKVRESLRSKYERGQMKMAGTDTDLSLACDAFLKPFFAKRKAEEEIKDAKEKLAVVMKRHNKSSVAHGGVIIIIQVGKIQSDKILVRGA